MEGGGCSEEVVRMGASEKGVLMGFGNGSADEVGSEKGVIMMHGDQKMEL